jgi:nitronate monooxygenase
MGRLDRQQGARSIAFQFGTRPLLTQESPIPEAWKQRLLTLKPGDVLLQPFSPTGFYSSAVRNDFLQELEDRNERQVAFTSEPVGDHIAEYGVGAAQADRLPGAA